MVQFAEGWTGRVCLVFAAPRGRRVSERWAMRGRCSRYQVWNGGRERRRTTLWTRKCDEQKRVYVITVAGAEDWGKQANVMLGTRNARGTIAKTKRAKDTVYDRMG